MRLLLVVLALLTLAGCSLPNEFRTRGVTIRRCAPPATIAVPEEAAPYVWVIEDVEDEEEAPE